MDLKHFQYSDWSHPWKPHQPHLASKHFERNWCSERAKPTKCILGFAYVASNCFQELSKPCQTDLDSIHFGTKGFFSFLQTLSTQIYFVHVAIIKTTNRDTSFFHSFYPVRDIRKV